jgi:hypothetical protein
MIVSECYRVEFQAIGEGQASTGHFEALCHKFILSYFWNIIGPLLAFTCTATTSTINASLVLIRNPIPTLDG